MILKQPKLSGSLVALAMLIYGGNGLSQVMPQQQAGVCDYTDAALYSGWGWNAIAGESCPPADTAVVATNSQQPISQNGPSSSSIAICVSGDSDPDNDGWGWENSKTCRVDSAQNTPIQDNSQTPAAACVDTDGDGWGWDGSASCKAGGDITPVQNNDPVSVGDCIDTDNDGWGWNGRESCRIEASQPVVPSLPAVPQQPVAANACLDPDGDGYGWNGTSSCDPDLDPITPVEPDQSH